MTSSSERTAAYPYDGGHDARDNEREASAAVSTDSPLVAFIESCRVLGRGDLKARADANLVSRKIDVEYALDVLDRQLDHIVGYVIAKDVLLTCPECGSKNAHV